MAQLIVKLAQDSDMAIWDNYVRNHPDASPYHLYAWLQSVSCSYHHQIFRLIAIRNDRIVGVLPLALFKFAPFLRELVAGPYCDKGNCLADSASEEEALLAKTIEIARQNKAGRIHLRGSLVGMLPEGVVPASNKVSMLLDLPGTSEELLHSFKSKLRSQIRKAEKNGLSFKWGQMEDIEDFYSVFSKNMHALGSPVHSRKWIENVLKNYGEHARMGLVYLNSQAIGCGIILVCGNKVAIPWASTLREYNKFNPNMFLYWNFLQYSADNQFELFDFGRSTPGEGTYNFKAQWGALPHPLDWYTLYLTKRNKEKTKLKLSSRDNRKCLASLWAHIPLCVANFLGPRLRRHISL